MSISTQTLEEIIRYYDRTRQSGHTTTMMEGALRTDCLIVAHSHKGAEFLKAEHNVGGKYITLLDIANGKLRDRELTSLAFDNAALYDILMEALLEIRRREVAQSELRNRVVKFLNEIDATIGKA